MALSLAPPPPDPKRRMNWTPEQLQEIDGMLRAQERAIVAHLTSRDDPPPAARPALTLAWSRS